MRSLSLAAAAAALCAFATIPTRAAEEPFRARPGRSEPTGAHALVDAARIVLGPGRVLENASLVVRDGRIEQVGAEVRIPADAVVHDCSGKTIWPGFVDAHVELGRLRDAEAPAPDSALSHPNARVRPERRVRDLLQLDPKKVAALREAGFTAAAVVPDAGILRGRGLVMQLGEGSPAALVISESDEQHASFESGSWGDRSYPSSTMGATAVLRQALLDADWYRRAWSWADRHRSAPRPERHASFEALAELAPQRGRPAGRLVFETRNVLDALRALEVADEFDLPVRLVGSGEEYRRLPQLAAAKVPVVLPVDFPPAPAAADEDEWREVSTRELLHWKRAPDNPRWLHEAGLEVSLSSHRLDSPGAFAAAVRRCLEGGLPAEVALAMVTTAPAKLLGVDDRLGTLDPGKDASFVVAHGGPFDEGTAIREVWVAGRRSVVSRVPEGLDGRWDVTFEVDGLKAARDKYPGTLSIKGAQGSFTPKDLDEDDGVDPQRAKLSDFEPTRSGAVFTIPGEPLGLREPARLTVKVAGGRLQGETEQLRVLLSGLRRLGPDPDKKLEVVESPAAAPPPFAGPLAPGDDWLIEGVTAWTVTDEGVLQDVDVLVSDGRIAAVGRTLEAPRGAVRVEGRGLHLTPGLIDAHSHAAIVGGVNEGTNSCTAEVRIGDVVNSETLNLHRQLAGGLTAANLLHGSANCMGGQSQVIKLRDGAPPAELKFAEATPAIKFALGENVKQSNWGADRTTRFPQTRMGVETFMRQKFLEALDYRETWRRWDKGRERSKMLPPRRDLQLETLVEILEGERKIHCHSYRQDEILMLMRVAEEFGFRIGTFQHILEGYKVADEMAAHGAMGSSFTDWWAYKFEVYDAIPHNPSLMAERGVIVSVNSDSAELARRMNLEAAKVAKWGGLPEHEALKFVTLHPAIQLGVDGVVGSIEAGKQADLVLWSGPPLSTGSRAEKTWVDGRLYFDRELDLEAQAEAAAERAALIAEAKDGDGGKAGGKRREPPAWAEEGHDHCLDNTGALDDHDLLGGLR